MTAAELFAQALTSDDCGRVWFTEIDIARQAVELHLTLNGDAMTLLKGFHWLSVEDLLAIFLTGDDLTEAMRKQDGEWDRLAIVMRDREEKGELLPADSYKERVRLEHEYAVEQIRALFSK